MHTLIPTFSVLMLCFLMMPHSFAQSPQIMWWYDVNDAAFGQAATADLDHDDSLEIVFSTYRNDGWAHCLNGRDGSVHWTFDMGGCGDVAPTIYDVDGDDTLDVIIPGSCNPTTFCINGATGLETWSSPMRGSDSPPVIANLDSDPMMEIIHGEFQGYVICFDAENGNEAWELGVDLDSWIQTAPIVMDVNEDSIPDFIVGNWSFGDNHKIFCFRSDTQDTLWTSTLPNDVMYHGASYADLDGDGRNEIVIGDYEGQLLCLNAEDGSLAWQYSIANPFYVGAPTSIGDLDKDGQLDIIMIDAWTMVCLTHDGQFKWSYTIPSVGQSFRGAALSDINGDDTLDVVFGTSMGDLIALHGPDGSELWTLDLEAHYGNSFEIDHGPLIADFDQDGDKDVFVVGGHAEFPNVQNNYGRAYAVSAGPGTGPDWTMFRHDIGRQACVCPDSMNSTGLFDDRDAVDLLSAYPNPARDQVFFNIHLEKAGMVQLRIHNLVGQLIWQPDTEYYPAGSHQIRFSPTQQNISSGTYLASLIVDGQASRVAKLVVE